MSKICIFDAYGTLFDINAAARKYASFSKDNLFIEQWESISTEWRDKQLSYTWLYSAMGVSINFWQVTEDALTYVLERRGLSKNYYLRSKLLDLYETLDIFPEVEHSLAKLKKANFLIGILSNGTELMLKKAISNSSISNYFDSVISIDKVGFFKPNQKVYLEACKEFGCRPDDVLFISSNGWDAAAAKKFGFSVLWINRNSLPVDKLPWTPDFINVNLNCVLDVVKKLSQE